MHRSIAALLQDAREEWPRAAAPKRRSASGSTRRSRSCAAPSPRGWKATSAPRPASPAAAPPASWPTARGCWAARVTTMLARAIGTLEVNAAMGLIVAAPTAGAAGVLPAILITAGEILEEDEDRLVDAMLVAGGVGGVIAHRASLSGAAGGCQAETGSAAAMGAAAVTWLAGGDRRAGLHLRRPLPPGHARPHLRPHRRARRDPLHLPQRLGRHAGAGRRRDGAGRPRLPRPRRRGDRRHGRGGPEDARRLPRDRPGRPRRHAVRPPPGPDPAPQSPTGISG
jgi:hypothetical protein